MKTGSLAGVLSRAAGVVLGLFVIPIMPVVETSLPRQISSQLFAAFADDDDGGGGGGGGGAGGGGGGGGNTSDGGWRNAPDYRYGRASRRVSRQNCFWIFCKQRVVRVYRQRATPAARRHAGRVRPSPAASAAGAGREYVVWNASAEQAAALERARFTIVSRADLSAGGSILRVRAAPGTQLRTALRRINSEAPGAIAGENLLYRAFTPTGGRTSAALASRRSFGNTVACSAGIDIAMIDTAIDAAHPTLAGALLTRAEVRASDRTPSGMRHGTAVASLIIGTPEGPAPGLAPQVRLHAVDAFHRDKSSTDRADVYDLARALDQLGAHPARVVNLSLTGPNSPVTAAAIAALQARGKLIVAAAGNDGPRALPVYPAAHPGVIAVAALDREGKPWRRSAQGAHIGFAAEGVDLLLAGVNGSTESFSGTSFSAPIVTAMLAAKINVVPDADLAALRDRLVRLAADRGAPGRDPVYGHGALDPSDACRAFSMANDRTRPE